MEMMKMEMDEGGDGDEQGEKDREGDGYERVGVSESGRDTERLILAGRGRDEREDQEELSKVHHASISVALFLISVKKSLTVQLPWKTLDSFRSQCSTRRSYMAERKAGWCLSAPFRGCCPEFCR